MTFARLLALLAECWPRRRGDSAPLPGVGELLANEQSERRSSSGDFVRSLAWLAGVGRWLGHLGCRKKNPAIPGARRKAKVVVAGGRGRTGWVALIGRAYRQLAWLKWMSAGRKTFVLTKKAANQLRQGAPIRRA
jgi:hypothetical protein